MNGNPLVSVLIPTYNCARYIGEAIDSILAQDYPNLEVIVVDDGSTDNTREIVQRIVGALRATPLRNPIKYFYQENHGISAARNFALEKASGEYIAWCDADDFWAEGKLKEQVEYMQQNIDCQIVFTAYTNFFTENVGPLAQNETGQKKFKYYLVSSLAKKEIFDRAGGFLTSLQCNEDTEMLYRLKSVFDVTLDHYIDQIFYCRRFHGNNTTLLHDVSSNDTKNNRNELQQILLQNLEKRLNNKKTSL